MIQENYKRENRITVEVFLTFPGNRQSFQVLDLCRAATEACHLTHGICLGHRETFLAIHVLCSIHHRHRLTRFRQRSKTEVLATQRCKPQAKDF